MPFVEPKKTTKQRPSFIAERKKKSPLIYFMSGTLLGSTLLESPDEKTNTSRRGPNQIKPTQIEREEKTPAIYFDHWQPGWSLKGRGSVSLQRSLIVGPFVPLPSAVSSCHVTSYLPGRGRSLLI